MQPQAVLGVTHQERLSRLLRGVTGGWQPPGMAVGGIVAGIVAIVGLIALVVVAGPSENFGDGASAPAAETREVDEPRSAEDRAAFLEEQRRALFEAGMITPTPVADQQIP